VLAFTGSIGSTGQHAHHAVQITTATTAVTVVDEAGRTHHGRQVIVPADAPHRIDTGAQVGWLVFLDPDTAAGRGAHQRSSAGSWTAEPPLPDTEPGRPLDALVGTVIHHLAQAPEADRPRHRAVVEALTVLPELISAGTVRGTDIAARVGVSPSRLTHLFSEQVGLPLRRYLLWLRLRTAIEQVRAGADLTDAAHAAGFADSAHLTRTCRDMFGLAPSAMSRHIAWDIADRT
jgi:AraC-like DNA-binding protein